ncbi:HYR domain-containing protein, partial [Salmonella sp. s54925]|uniref:HYR domain-containing protein n=1 Tax=Salmonella sp. s54925 TaxID=3159674 RepID=UPI00397F1D7C
EFTAGIDYEVVYTAYDPSLNKAECRFHITIKEECKDADIPVKELSCSIPAADLSKCDKKPPYSVVFLLKQICRKTCKAC